MYTRLQVSCVCILLGASILSLAVGTIEPASAVGEEHPDDSYLTPFTLSLDFSSPPVASQTTTLTLTSIGDISLSSAEHRLNIPSYFTVVDGTPSNYSLTSGVDPWDEAVQYVSWVTSAQQGVTDTFSLNVIPHTESDGFDEFTAVARDIANEVALGSTAVWAKIGASAPESQTVSSRPAQNEFTADGTLLNINTIDDAGQWVPYAGGPVSPNDLPALLPTDDPFEIGFKLLSAPVSSQVTSAQVRIENTTSQTEALTGTIQLPAGWSLRSGSLSIVAILGSSSVLTQTVQFIPDAIDGDWKIDVSVYPSQSSPNDINPSPYLISQFGSGAAGVGSIGIQTQETRWSVEAVSGSSGHGLFGGTASPVHSKGAADTSGFVETLSSSEVCPLCGSYDFGMATRIEIVVRLQSDRTYEGGDLYMIVYGYTGGTIGFPARRVRLGNVLTDDNGLVTLCIGPDQDIPPLSALQLELLSHDSVGSESASSGYSVRTLDPDTELPYREMSAIYPLFSDWTECAGWHLVDFNLLRKVSEPFVITTLISVDAREFMLAEGNVSIHSASRYPVDMYYPVGLEGSGSCWEECFIPVNFAHDSSSLIYHEYGHHVQFSVGGQNFAVMNRAFFEGWANYFTDMVGKSAYARGDEHFEEFEDLTYDGSVDDVNGGAAIFWDYWDATPSETLPGCTVTDTVSTGFDVLLQRLDPNIDFSVELHALSHGYYDSWPSPVPAGVHAQAFSHNISTATIARDACLP